MSFGNVVCIHTVNMCLV